MTGKIIAYSYYRIGVYQWKQTDLEKKTILDKFIRKAIEILGGCEEPEKLIRIMKDYWNKYTQYGLKEPMLQANKKVNNVDLSKYKWYVGRKQIEALGCNHLSRAQWPALQSLDLSNSI